MAAPIASTPTQMTAQIPLPAASPMHLESLSPAPPSVALPPTNGVEASSTPTPGPSTRKDEEKKLELVGSMDAHKVAGIRKRIVDLQNAGHSKENSTEFAKLSLIMELYAKTKSMEAGKTKSVDSGSSGPSGPSGQGQTNGVTISVASPAAAPSPAAPQPAALTPSQIAQLRAQVAVNQLLSRNQPVPEHLMKAATGISPPGVAGQPAMPNPLGDGLDAKVVEKTVDAVVGDNLRERTEAAAADGPDEAGKGARLEPYAMEFDQNSIIYPYNAFTHPSVYAQRKFDDEVANPLNKMQRMIVPSTMPKGLDPYLLMEERNRFIDNRIAWRMKELEEMDATADMGEHGGKEMPGLVNGKNLDQAGMRARIELLSLRLLAKQRLLREDVVRVMHGATQVPADRSQFRRFRTHTLRDARATETAERRQRSEREQRGKQRHLSYINSICEHGKAIVDSGVGSSGSTGNKMRRLGRAMLKMHADTEKEEARRIERLAKERLKALKNDDEEGYLALLGEAKNSQIELLLKQTDAYLETMAKAIVDQQNDDVHRDAIQYEPFEVEDGPANEAMFGGRRQDGEEEDAEAKQGKVDYYAVAHRVQEKVTRQASILTGGTLKDYQVKGLQWMISLYNNRLNGILADEMGLGKTIQTISLITYLIEKKRQYGPFLVIVPLSTLTNWTLEFERWAPAVRVLIMKGSPLARKDLYPRLRAMDFQVCLTTYEYIIKERPVMARIKWIHMIIDEGHRMKNVKSKLSQTLNEFYSARYRLILTGTPLQNNLPELWALLNFALPKIFNSVKSFEEWFAAPLANVGGEGLDLKAEEQLLVVKRLHKVLRPFLLRRLKKDVESELPDKVEKVIYTRLSGLQWALYRSVQQYKMLPFDTAGGRKKGPNLQNAIMQLRKICNHPFVYREVDEDFSVGNNIDEQIVRTAGKFELLDRLLPKLFATGHKVLIFFQMTEIMTIIADFFDYRGWKYCRLDGSTKAEDRQTLLSTFNDPQSPYQVFILSTRAGGLGLNLQSADTVIIYDTDWNPHADLQAQDRAHRIGQKKEVRVLRLISSSRNIKTVEEYVLQQAQKKLELDGQVIQAGKFDNVTTGDEYEALLAHVFEGGNDESEEVLELDDDELNEILARGDDELEIFTRMDKEREAAKVSEWRQAGNKGPPPPPLMQESELPPYYRRDIGEEFAAQMAAEEEQGRGRRVKADVRYTDGLTDDQWLNAVDASDDDVDDAVERKRKRLDKKAERKRMNEMLAKAEAEGKPLSSIKIKQLQAEEEPKGKKRSRPTKSATPSVVGDDVPSKKRKVVGGGESEVAIMTRLFTAVNTLKSEAGEDLNMYFLTPVDKKLYPDYYAIIAKPIAMSQIKRKLGQASYSLQALKADLHLLWDNARTYNQEDSWVYNAAEDMQEHFDKLWEEEMGRASNVGTGNTGGNGSGLRVGGLASTSDEASAAPSGTSTPMFRTSAVPLKLPPKIKISVGASRRREVEPDPTPEPEQEDSEVGSGGGSGDGSEGDEDEDDDDY